MKRMPHTVDHCQLVVTELRPKQEIGAEVHELNQLVRVEQGSGEAMLDGARIAIHAGSAVLVPAGSHHNIINTGTVPLKFYTLFARPIHRDRLGQRHRSYEEAGHEHREDIATE